MGNRNTKRTTFCSNNEVKKDCLRKIQKNFKQKPKQSERPLDMETSGQLCVPPVDSSDENAGGGTFYKFVILHAEDDIEEAIRVQDVLQNEFSIKPGIIFAEMPSGKHVLENFSDAVNGAAWIVILLTENFLHELWCEFQSYASLFNALIIPHKCNTVIPLRPRNNPLPWNRTPFILQTINALQEDSPGFAAQVKRTFQESRYRQQQAIWWHEKKGRHKNSVDGESVSSFSEAEGPFF